MTAPGAPGGAQETSGSRIVQRLAKSLIADNEHPGFAFPYRGMHTTMWYQMQTLIKYHKSWGESRTWKYNTFAPGQPYLSLLDRIEKDDVFKLNLILNGGWTKDTMPFLPRLVEQGLDQKAWNRRCGHIAFGDRRDYYIRRAARFKIRNGASDEAHSRLADAPNLTEAEERETQVRNLGKGKGIAALTAPPTRAPDPAVKFSTCWNRGSGDTHQRKSS